ncbi:hypothetical protein I4U23_022500 [Adineta vaga]|nr:hypothetical protein I4U23_022500 [Adineta vaga]
MIRGYQLSQVLYVVTKLNITDLLALHGPMKIDELARLTGTHAPSLERLLRTLIHINIFKLDENGFYSSTSLGKLLETNSLRSTVLTWVEPSIWQTWGSLFDSIKTGQSSFDRLYQMNFYQYLGENSQTNSVFNECMASAPRHEKFVETYDGFLHASSVVDVGGGTGELIFRLLRKHTHLKGILYDLPHVTNTINLQDLDKSITDRLTIVGGDMFSNIPNDGDIYILSHIFMGLTDNEARILLKNCRQAMQNGKHLLIIDVVNTSSSDANQDNLLKEMADIHMLVLLGGKFRTKEEFEVLLENEHLKLNRIIPLMGSAFYVDTILECIAI